MKNLPVLKIRRVICHEHFYYIIIYFIILQKNIDILLAGLVKEEDHQKRWSSSLCVKIHIIIKQSQKK